MSFEKLAYNQVYNNCILPLVNVKGLASLCVVSKTDREYALQEIFKRVGSFDIEARNIYAGCFSTMYNKEMFSLTRLTLFVFLKIFVIAIKFRNSHI